MKPDAINSRVEVRAESTRRVEREWLDGLPPDDSRAIRSRRDLRRLNKMMGHVGILASMLHREACPANVRVVELGSGDGTFLLRLARRMRPIWTDVEAYLVDQQWLLEPDTAAQFSQLGWRARSVQANVFEWLDSPSAPTWTVTTANLFLHHFEDADLARLFEGCARRCELFVACEPRRARFPLWAARMLGCIGCNGVTRHDAVISVRAGFRHRELSRLWPDTANEWRLEERAAGLFSHCFSARRLSDPNSISR